jgi:hypothetical protein
MDDVIGMQICQPIKDLGGERFDHLLAEPAVFPQITHDGPPRDVFQESAIVGEASISFERTKRRTSSGRSRSPRIRGKRRYEDDVAR